MADIKFSTLMEDGTEIFNKTLKRESLLKCPHTIFTPEHYREDESCRCDDPEHTEMAEWGYTWRDGMWTAVDEEDEL